jgi:hypothetical protein
MKFTVDQFSTANSVEKPVAYGVLRFFAERGFATTTKTDKVAGKRGKPSTIYTLTPEAITAFGSSIKEYVAPVVEVAVVTEQIVETSPVSEQPAAV